MDVIAITVTTAVLRTGHFAVFQIVSWISQCEFGLEKYTCYLKKRPHFYSIFLAIVALDVYLALSGIH